MGGGGKVTCPPRPVLPGLRPRPAARLSCTPWSLFSPQRQRPALTLPGTQLAPSGPDPVLSASPEVDVEGMEFGPGELDSVGSSSDVDDHYSLQSDGGYGPPCRRPARPGLS